VTAGESEQITWKIDRFSLDRQDRQEFTVFTSFRMTVLSKVSNLFRVGSVLRTPSASNIVGSGELNCFDMKQNEETLKIEGKSTI
jgi:hypothetical protein